MLASLQQQQFENKPEDHVQTQLNFAKAANFIQQKDEIQAIL